MVIKKNNPAWRTKACKFFATQGWCSKVDLCCFAHFDAEGKDLHIDVDPEEIDGEPWYEGEGTEAVQETLAEDQSNEVGETAEPCEEGEEEFKCQPHFGVFPGIGP